METMGSLHVLLAQVCEATGRALEEVTALSIAGNTVMEHLLACLSPGSIAVAPFTSQSLFGQVAPADN